CTVVTCCGLAALMNIQRPGGPGVDTASRKRSFLRPGRSDGRRPRRIADGVADWVRGRGNWRVGERADAGIRGRDARCTHAPEGSVMHPVIRALAAAILAAFAIAPAAALDLQLKDRVVLVTGSTSNIGYATARLFL